MASWDLLELPVVDANQWEANREVAREADAAFNAELLQRAEQWQQQQEEQQQQAETAASEANARPRRAYEHERSRDFAEDADGVTSTDVQGRTAEGVTSPGTGPPDGHGSLPPLSEGREGTAGVTQGDSSPTAVKTGLVGIMFDSVAN